VIVASYILSPILSLLQRKWHFKTSATLEWCINETLQLQRLAHEEIGCGTWSKAAQSVPITLAGEKLACLDLTDPSHPKLEPPTKTEASTDGSHGGRDSGDEITEEPQEVIETLVIEQPLSDQTELGGGAQKKPIEEPTVTELDGCSSRRNSA
jgi:hypothetical protein